MTLASVLEPVLGPALSPALGQGVGGGLSLNSLVVGLGSSITEAWGGYIGPDRAFIGNGWPTWALALSGNRLFSPFNGNQAISGDTPADMLARVPTVVALQPAIVLMNSGDPTLSEASNETAIAAIYAALFAGGVKYIIDTTIGPRFSTFALTAPQETVRQNINTWKKTQAGAKLKIIDIENVIAWSATVGTFDGLHYGTDGAYAVGSAAATVLATLTSGDVIGSMTNVFSANPTMSGTGGSKTGGATGTVADSMTLANGNSGGATVAGSKGTMSNGTACQIITISGSKTGNSKTITLDASVAASGIAAGDELEFAFECEATGLTNVKAIRANILVQDAGANNLIQAETMYSSNDLPYPGVGVLTFRTPANFVQAGTPSTQNFSFGIDLVDGSVSVAGVIKIGRSAARKVPAGLDPLPWTGPTTNLVHRIPLDNANVSGATATDVIGALNGTITGAAAATGPNGRPNTGRSFGGSDKIVFPSALLNLGANHTVLQWLKLTNPSGTGGGGASQRMLISGADTSNLAMVSNDETGAGKLDLSLKIGGVEHGGETTAAVFAAGIFTQVGWTWNGTSSVLIKDSGAVAAGGEGGFGLGTLPAYQLGQRGDGNGGMIGSMGEVLVYSAVLTASQLVQAYRAGHA